MPSDEPLLGLCGARVRTGDGYCQKHPINGTGRCRLHGGAGGAPKGNQNAVGNAGGGAPEGNLNALRNGLHVDPLTFYLTLWEEDRQYVQRTFWERVDRTDWRPQDIRLERLALSQITFAKEITASADTLRRGLVIEVETGETSDGEPITAHRMNSNVSRQLRFSARHREVHTDLGLYATGDSTYFTAPQVIERPLSADRSLETIIADAVDNEALDEFGQVRDSYTIENEYASASDDRSFTQRLIPFLDWLADLPETDIALPADLSTFTVWRAIHAVRTDSGSPETVVSALRDETEA